jgi:hypothetical protein
MNRISKNAKAWKLDESKLTPEQVELLKSVSFPFEVNNRQAVQKRIDKDSFNGSYMNKRSFGLESIKYVTMSHRVALKQAAKAMPKSAQAKEFLDKALALKQAAKAMPKSAQAKEFLDKALANKPKQFIYFDGHSIEEEMYNIISRYGRPAPTPSMQVEQPKEAAKTKPKGLSNTHKKKARDMYDGGADADEIAEELGKGKNLVIDYLKKLEDA